MLIIDSIKIKEGRKMIKRIKQWFCKHHYKLMGSGYIDPYEPDTWKERHLCWKCGKWIITGYRGLTNENN
jgi:hypothetical protein